MELKTKFNIGEGIWVLCGKEPLLLCVSKIYIEIEDDVRISYSYYDDVWHKDRHIGYEPECFHSREEVIKNIKNK